MITKPMLAAKADPAALRFPLIATPKLDGIRCLLLDGEALTRTFKPVPNEATRMRLERVVAPLVSVGYALDGELLLADRRATFQDVSSALMSRDGAPDVVFHVFDCVHVDRLDEPYEERLERLAAETEADDMPAWVRAVPHELVYDLAGLEAYEAAVLADGYEGVCLRAPDSPYKCGRSTAREQALLKLKRFVDAEAVLIGLDEAEANRNPQQRSATGAVKRSSAKAGKVRKGTLGALVCRAADGTEFRIGTGVGLTAALRQAIWDAPDRYVGRLVKFRYQEQGTKDRPRIPSFLGFRGEEDL